MIYESDKGGEEERVHWGIPFAERLSESHGSPQRSAWSPLAWSTPFMTIMVNTYEAYTTPKLYTNALTSIWLWLPNSSVKLVGVRCPFHGCENWTLQRINNLPSILKPELENRVIYLAQYCMSRCQSWLPGLTESLREQTAKYPRTSCWALSSPLNFSPTHPAVRRSKLATYKAQHGGKGYLLWSAGAHDQATLSGTADWENVAGPCSAFLLQEIHKTECINHRAS